MDFKPLLKELLKDLEIAIKAVMVQRAPSLKGSDIVNSVEVTMNSKNEIIVWANHYWDYIDKGRRPFTKKVPISALLTWIRKKGLKGRSRKGRFISHNQLAFAIQTVIFKRGIKGKLFDQAVDDTIEEVTDIILDQRALDILTSDLDAYFNE